MISLELLADDTGDLMLVRPPVFARSLARLCTICRITARNGALNVYARFFILLCADLETVPPLFKIL